MRPVLNTQFERRQHGFHESLDTTCLEIPKTVTVQTPTIRRELTTVSTDPACKHLGVPDELADQPDISYSFVTEGSVLKIPSGSDDARRPSGSMAQAPGRMGWS